jgi:23S rRNA (guanosine2251-2'-O)-methyltransferase
MSDELIYGIHACEQFLAVSPEQVELVFLQEGAASKRVKDELNLGAFDVRVLTRQEMDQKCSNGNHQGLILQVKAFHAKTEKQLDAFAKALLDEGADEGAQPLILILDGVTDPHNLGACLRSAAAAGVSAVVLPKDKSVGVNATVRKVAAGAVEKLDIFVVTNLARSIEKLKSAGVWVAGTALNENAKNIYQCDLKGPLAFAES